MRAQDIRDAAFVEGGDHCRGARFKPQRLKIRMANAIARATAMIQNLVFFEGGDW
jgi:hypothetical protein